MIVENLISKPPFDFSSQIAFVLQQLKWDNS